MKSYINGADRGPVAKGRLQKEEIKTQSEFHPRPRSELGLVCLAV